MARSSALSAEKSPARNTSSNGRLPVEIRQRKLLMDSQRVDAENGEPFSTFNPATGEVIAQVAEADKADMDKAHRLAAEPRAGTVWVNCYDVIATAAPFGGFKMSGTGCELGEYGLRNYTEIKVATMAMDT